MHGEETGIHLTSKDIFQGRECHVAETVLYEKRRTFLHDHDFYELFIITQGDVLHLVNKEVRIIQRNTLCLVCPEDMHQFEKADEEEAHFFNIAFLPSVMEEAYHAASLLLQTEIGNGQDVLHEIMLSENLSEIFLHKMKLLSSDPAEITKEQRHAMLVSLAADCLIWLAGKRGSKSETFVPGWLRNACREMNKEENYTAGIERFVALTGKSQEHVSRCMRKYYGIKPSELVNRIRLEAVAEKLKSSDETILEIMLSCGFNNVSYFNKVFRDYYGSSPREYRKWNQAVVDPRFIARHQQFPSS